MVESENSGKSKPAQPVTDSLEFYSPLVSPKDMVTIMAMKPMVTQVIPELCRFAHFIRNANETELIEFMSGFSHHSMTCDCWHCEVINKKIIITAQDYYYRLLLLENGEIQCQLN